MNWWQRRKLKNSLLTCASTVHRRLVDRHRSRKSYTLEEVTRAALDSGLPRKHLPYAYAMFCSRKNLAGLSESDKLPRQIATMRREIVAVTGGKVRLPCREGWSEECGLAKDLIRYRKKANEFDAELFNAPPVSDVTSAQIAGAWLATSMGSK